MLKTLKLDDIISAYTDISFKNEMIYNDKSIFQQLPPAISQPQKGTFVHH